MKRHRFLILILAAMLILSYDYSIPTVNANTLSETPENNSDTLSDKVTALSGEDSVQKSDAVPEDKPDPVSDEDSLQKQDTMPETQSDVSSDGNSVSKPDSVDEDKSVLLPDADIVQKQDSISENDLAALSDKDSTQKIGTVPENDADTLSDIQIPDEKPAFSATIEHCSDGYVVKGHFTEFLPDTSFAIPQYSLDGEAWQDCILEWNLSKLGCEDSISLYNLQHQIFLYSSFEPFKSYLTGELDVFYLRLSITMKNGMTYETQTVLMKRSDSKPVSEEITYTANFAPSMLTYGVDASGTRSYCGRYQLTVRESSSPEDIVSLLPDTIPVQVDLYKNKKFFANCTIDCPVTWKPLSFTGLTAGEIMSIQDAAEEVTIPAGTILQTPVDTFMLDKPLGLEQGHGMTDDIILVLNVIPDGTNPTGVLSGSIHGLEIAFDFKPTGATAIHAYTLSDGASEWAALPDLPLAKIISTQPSTASSGYTYILNSDQEPYRSYLQAKSAGEEPDPFLIGLKIEGGIYDGCQLILAYPDTYDFPPDLCVGGSGGNHGNAGSSSRNDSTEEGQRPNLRQTSADTNADLSSDSFPNATDPSWNPPDDTGNIYTNASETSTDNVGNRQTNASEIPKYNTENRQTDTSEPASDHAENRQTDSLLNEISEQERQTDSKTVYSQTQPDTSVLPSAITPAIMEDSVEENSWKRFLPIAASVIVGIYITITVTKAITGSITKKL